jgi:beta-ureidopropionase / N-carbamoyl-L-amino-acid hydrolase
MASGVAHDAQKLASFCTTGMIFIPSRGGISHNEAEYSSPDEVEAGCVLMRTILSLAAA